MRASASAAAGAVVDSRKANHRSRDVVVAARIKQRRPGRTAGTPVFGDAVVRRQAESFVELAVVQLSQHLLVENRDFAPFIGIVEFINIDAIELSVEERRAAGCATARFLRSDCTRSISRRVFGRSASDVIRLSATPR